MFKNDQQKIVRQIVDKNIRSEKVWRLHFTKYTKEAAQQ